MTTIADMTGRVTRMTKDTKAGTVIGLLSFSFTFVLGVNVVSTVKNIGRMWMMGMILSMIVKRSYEDLQLLL